MALEIWWVGHVARSEHEKQKNFDRNVWREKSLVKPRSKWLIQWKRMLMKQCEVCALDVCELRYGTVANFCEHSSEPLVFVTDERILMIC